MSLLYLLFASCALCTIGWCVAQLPVITIAHGFWQVAYRFSCHVGDRMSELLDQVLSTRTRSATSKQLPYNAHLTGRLCAFAWSPTFAPMATFRPLPMRQYATIGRNEAVYPILI